MKKRILAACLLLFTLAAIADTQGYLIRSKFKKGQVERIKTVYDYTVELSSMSGMGRNKSLTYQTIVVQKRTITGVNKDGSAQVKLETESLKNINSGKLKEVEKEDLPSMSYTIDAMGRISKTVTLNEHDDPMQEMFQEFDKLTANRPEKPVKIGDTWTVKNKSSMHPSKETTSTYKLESIEPFGSDKAYKLKANIEMPVDFDMPEQTIDMPHGSMETPPASFKGAFKGVGIILIRVSDAQLIRNDTDMTMEMDLEMDSPDIPAQFRKAKMNAKGKIQQFQLPTTRIR